MQRIHAFFDESTLTQIDREVAKRDIICAQWLSSAISSYLAFLSLLMAQVLANWRRRSDDLT